MRKTLERIDTLLRGGFTQREQLRAGQVAAGIGCYSAGVVVGGNRIPSEPRAEPPFVWRPG